MYKNWAMRLTLCKLTIYGFGWPIKWWCLYKYIGKIRAELYLYNIIYFIYINLFDENGYNLYNKLY